MKLYLPVRITVLLLSTLFATGVFASDHPHKGSLELGTNAIVNGKQLRAGSYQVTWDGNGPDVALNIVQDGKVVATTPAQVVDLSEKPAEDTAELHTNPDGRRSLSEIRFSGKKYALSIGEETAQNQSQTKIANANK